MMLAKEPPRAERRVPVQIQGEAVRAVAFSPDGRLVVTGTGDGTAQMWEMYTRRPLGPPVLLPGTIHGLGFSPDGRTVLAAVSAGTPWTWPVPASTEGEVERLRLWAQVETHLEVDDKGVVQALEGDPLEQRRRRLQELGGPPLPVR
jgi:WD40 repeat protein